MLKVLIPKSFFFLAMIKLEIPLLILAINFRTSRSLGFFFK